MHDIACRRAKAVPDKIVGPEQHATMQAKANRRLALLGRLSGSVMFFGCFAWNGVNFMYAATRERLKCTFEYAFCNVVCTCTNRK
jgi:hypothetical protein